MTTDARQTTTSFYTYPREAPRSDRHFVRVNGTPVFVYQTPVSSFAAFSCDGAVEIEVDCGCQIDSFKISPLSRGIEAHADGNRLRFGIPGPMNLALEINGEDRSPLFIYANPLPVSVPDRADPSVRYFEAGKVHDAGEILLTSGQTLYIEGGAVVHGVVRARNAEDVKIDGHGVMDGTRYRGRGWHFWPFIVFEDCVRPVVRNWILIEPTGWTLVFRRCSDVRVSNVKQIAQGNGTDGIDLVSVNGAVIEDCILRNGDDCVVIKAMGADRGVGSNCENITVRRCALLNVGAGNALEVGHELRCEHVRNVTFTDCDVLCAHGHGAAISIHNAARATVSNLLFENIRVQHHYEYLIDCKIIESMWSRDPVRGQIRDVTFRNITVDLTEFNPGYSISTLGGFDADHMVENVVFEDVVIGGRKVLNGDMIDLYTKQVKGIVFR